MTSEARARSLIHKISDTPEFMASILSFFLYPDVLASKDRFCGVRFLEAAIGVAAANLCSVPLSIYPANSLPSFASRPR